MEKDRGLWDQKLLTLLSFEFLGIHTFSISTDLNHNSFVFLICNACGYLTEYYGYINSFCKIDSEGAMYSDTCFYY